MNQLSWMLYLADFAGSVGSVFAGLTFIGILGFVICMIAVPVSEGEVLEKDVRPVWLKVTRGFVVMGSVGFMLNAIIPAKETVYAIAASEMGEQVVTSPTGQKAVKALEAWLDRQIEPAK